MSEEFSVRQGTQIIVGDLRIGVIAAGLADGEPAARLALRDSRSVQDVVLRPGERADAARHSVVLLAAAEDDQVPGAGTAVLRVADRPG